MRCASDQLTKCTAFDQMRNVWPNVHAFAQTCANGQLRAHLANRAAHLPKCAVHLVNYQQWPNANSFGEMHTYLLNCAVHLAKYTCIQN